MNSPVVILPSGEEKKVLASSPTSTAHEFMDCDNGSLRLSDVESTVNRLTCSTELNACTFLNRSAHLKKKPPVLKTIHNSDIKISRPFSSVFELKSIICEDTLVSANDIIVVRDGKELRNDLSLTELSPKTFILLKTSVTTSVPISLKPQGIEGGLNKTLKVPLNMRVFQLKKQLFNSKFSSLKPESQRIIVGGKVLHDSYMIGDYLLPSILGKKNSSVPPSSSSPTASASKSFGSTGSSFKPSIPTVATLYLSKTVNVKHEVDVEIPLTNGSVITCPLEISQPISTLVKILNRRHFFPLPNDEFFYVFSLKVPRSSSLVDRTSPSGSVAFGPLHQLKKTIEKESKNSPSGFELVELDLNKTLIDYGFTQSTKKISVEIARSHNLKADDSRPVEFSEMLFIYLVAMAERRVQRQAQGLPLDEVGPIQMTIPVPLRMPLHPPSALSSSSRRNRIGSAAPALFGSGGSAASEALGMPTTSEVQHMLEAMGMDKEMIKGILNGEDPRSMSGIDLIGNNSNADPVTSSVGSISKKRATPEVSSADSSVVSGASTTKPSAGPTNKKSTTSNTTSKGGLFGGLKKGFLSGSSKKDGK